jgi:hypothetical protein
LFSGSFLRKSRSFDNTFVKSFSSSLATFTPVVQPNQRER